jgi:beta-glucosidase-like glycosyl hydrolase
MSRARRPPFGRLLALTLSAVAGIVLAAQSATPPPLDRAAGRWVALTLKGMTLEQKIGQLLMPSFDTSYMSTDGQSFDRLARLVAELGVGGFAVFGQRSRPVPGVLLNEGYPAIALTNPFDVASALNRLQLRSKVPLLNGVDAEWGMGMRIAGATSFPRAMAFGAAGDETLAYEAGRITALEGRALGVHVDFAPVADVNNNPRNPVINTRSFGEDPARVGALASAFARGLAAGGMLATVKHFPGHGDTDVDSHLGLPLVSHGRERLDALELAPFRDVLGAGAAAVMVAHIELPALAREPGVPATLSAPVVTDLLRRELRFDGLVITDSMSMQAVARMLPAGEAAVRAVRAGNDIVLESADDRSAAMALKEAVQSGALAVAQLDAAVGRVLEAKARLRLHAARTVSLDRVPDVVGVQTHQALADEVSRRAVTLIKDDRQQVPLRLPAGAQVLYLSVLDYAREWGAAAPSRTLRPGLQQRWPNVTAVELTDRTTASEIDLVRAMAPRFDAIVAGVFVRASSGSGRLDLAPGIIRLLQQLARATAERQQPLLAAFFGSPYAAASVPELPAVLLTYDLYDRAEASVVRAIAGEAAIGGRLPVALPGLFPIGHGLDRAGPMPAVR